MKGHRRTFRYEDVRAWSIVTALTGVVEALASWHCFQILTEFHKGLSARTQITGDVTSALNKEGFGIEYSPLTVRCRVKNDQS